jgi:hypothetical protein
MLFSITLIPVGRASTNIYEASYVLQECNWLTCYNPEVSGVSATIEVNQLGNPETVNANNPGESVSEWISIDNHAASCHQWVQEGWILGTTSNGFVSTPYLYVESMIDNVYYFNTVQPAVFGNIYTFTIYLSNDGTTWDLVITGSPGNLYTVPVAHSSCQAMYGGQASGSIEIHEPAGALPSLSDSGVWNNLQFYQRLTGCISNYNPTWQSWGQSDPDSCYSNTTGATPVVNSCYATVFMMNPYTEFRAYATSGCGGGGGGGPHPTSPGSG